MAVIQRLIFVVFLSFIASIFLVAASSDAGSEKVLKTNSTKSDIDGDGLSNAAEIRVGSNLLKRDSDNDGIDDLEEVTIRTNPTKRDSDGDGVDDLEEITIGSNPVNDDTDMDGITDGTEVKSNFNPLDPRDGRQDYDSDEFSNRQEDLLGFDPANATSKPLDKGMKEWVFDGVGLVLGVPTIDKNGLIYYATEAGNVYSVYPNGKMNWRRNFDSEIYGSVELDENSSRLYFGTADGYLYARDLSGNPIWKVDTQAPVLGSPSVDRKGNIYVASGSRISAYDQQGATLWTKVLSGSVSIRSKLAISNTGQIIIANSSGIVIALDSISGRVKWEANVGGDLSQSAPVLMGKTIIVSGADATPAKSIKGEMIPVGAGGKLHKITSKGEVVWSVTYMKSPNDVEIPSAPVIGLNGNIYIGTIVWSKSGNTFSLLSYTTDGLPNWSYRLFGTPSSPALALDGTVYIADASGILHAVDSESGIRLWRNLDVAGNTLGSPVIAKDGTLYLAFNQGALQAYADNSGGPARRK